MKAKIDPWVNIVTFVIYILVFIKIVFLISSIGHLLLSHKKNPTERTTEFDQKFLGLKSKFEFYCIIIMSGLLIFIFTPWYDNMVYITREMKFLIYIFGFILILSADWDIYLPQSRIGEVINSTIG